MYYLYHYVLKRSGHCVNTEDVGIRTVSLDPEALLACLPRQWLSMRKALAGLFFSHHKKARKTLESLHCLKRHRVKS